MVEPAAAALLLLDIIENQLTEGPRCVAAMPTIKRMQRRSARPRHGRVLLTWSAPKRQGDARRRHECCAIKPRAGEWYRQPGPDKVLGLLILKQTLQQAGIETRDHLRQLIAQARPWAAFQEAV